MGKKPSYEELEQRIGELENEVLKQARAAAALLESEERFRLVFENSNIGMCLVDPESRIVKANAEMSKIFGYSKEELEGMTVNSIAHPEDLDISPRFIQRASSGEITRTEFEKRYIHKKGHTVWGQVVSSLVRDVKGVSQYFISHVKDITEQKQAEEALRESEAKYRAIVEDQTELICRFNRDCTLTFVNESYARNWGKTPNEMTGVNFLTLIPEHARENVQKHFSSFSPANAFQIQEHEVFGRNGEIHWQQWSNRAFFDGEGNIVEFQSVGRDMTERKRAEDALRESERKYSVLVQESPDAIISLDKIGNLLSFNPAAERISGFSAEEVIGKHFAKIGALAKKSIPKALKEFALVITGTKRPPFELTIMRKDKSYLFMEANPRLIKHKGKKAWVQVTLRDITDRKLVEAEKKQLETQLQQSQKMESIGTLAGGIAHDFNNILGIIIGNTELAMDDIPKRDRAYFNLEEIQKASLRAKDVVKQLLSFARKTDLERKPIKLIPVIKDSIQLLRAIIPMNIDIRQSITDTSHTIFADPTQINQVIINLCANASHAMQEKGGILGIEMENVIFEEDLDTLHPDLTPGSYVKLTISDTGRGIDPEVKDRIFDPYFTTKEIGKGTGMGLSVAHGIVQNHGGSISVESELGKGTTFYIYFPVIEEEQVIETETVEELPKGNERILFVDDDKSIIYVGRYRLERLGYQVETKTNPVEALELFRANPDQFDLVITDMAMPQMTGDHLVEEILKIRPDTPTILCTGFSEKIDEEKAKGIGAAEYFEKPVDKRNFAIKIRSVLDGKKV